MRLSIDIPSDWNKQLKQVALEADAQSVADFVRSLIGDAIGEAPVQKTWGRKKVTEDTQLTEVKKDTEVKASTTIAPPPEPLQSLPPKVEAEIIAEIAKVPAPAKQTATMTNNMTPSQIIAARKAAALEKHPLPKPLINNGKNK